MVYHVGDYVLLKKPYDGHVGRAYVVKVDTEGKPILIEWAEKYMAEHYIGWERDSSVPISYVSRGVNRYWNTPRSCVEDFELLSKSGEVIKTTNMSSLVSKFKSIVRSEPEKSFVKAGVMNDNEELTAAGVDLFLAFLLDKHGEDFKTSVVDKILAEQEKDKK